MNRLRAVQLLRYSGDRPSYSGFHRALPSDLRPVPGMSGRGYPSNTG
jgi:hypothetical protein